MKHSLLHIVLAAALVVAALIAAACDDSAQVPPLEPTPAQDWGGDFFDEALLMEGAVDLAQEAAEVTCVGATDTDLADPHHPKLIRGHVLGLNGELAYRQHSCAPSGHPKFMQGPLPPERSPGCTSIHAVDRTLWPQKKIFPDWLVASATASPLEDELGVGGVTVELYKSDARGEPVGKALVQTHTSRSGRWCLRVPEGVDFGPDLLLVASTHSTRLRRLLVSQTATDLYSQPEAIIRLLVARNITITNLSGPTLLNMQTLADTATDLLQPIIATPTDTFEDLIAKNTTALTADVRFAAMLDTLAHRH